jgi:hypothetical protein
MPVRILKSPILPREKKLNSETLKNLEYIKSKVGFQGKVNNFKERFFEKFFNKSNSFALAFNFAIVAISLIIFYFLAASFPVTTTIITPNFAWQIIKSDPIVVPTTEPRPPLVGTAGGYGEDRQSESYTLVVEWEKKFLDITYFFWSIIPTIVLFLIIYLPAIKWVKKK